MGAKRARGLELDLALLTLGLVVVLALSQRGAFFSTDEGSYAIQAHTLRDGAWSIHWPFRAVDATAAHFPYHGGTVSARGEFAYVSHPAWPAVLSVVTRVIPEQVGLRVLSLASVVGAALAGAGIACRLGGTVAGRWAFWIVATSPILADGLMVWAHAPSAALAGAAVLAALALSRRERGWWWAVLVAGLAGGVLIRSESLLLGLTLGGIVGLVGLWQREIRLIGIGLASGASTGVAFLAERAWIHRIVGSGGLGLSARDAGSAGGWLSGHLQGAGQSLLRGGLSSPGATLCSLAGFLLMAAAMLAWRRPDLVRVAPWMLVAAAGTLTLVRLVVGVDDPVTGLLVAWPVVALAALATGPRSGAEQLLLLGSSVFAVGVLATQYDDGGGLQWGGRYLAPTIVPLGAVAAVGLVAHVSAGRERQAVAALLAAGALLGLVITNDIRDQTVHQLRTVPALGRSVVVVANDQAARLDWASWPDRCWVSTDGDIPGTVRLLERAGVTEASYLGIRATAFAGSGAVAMPASRTTGTLHLVPATAGGAPVGGGAGPCGSGGASPVAAGPEGS